MKTNQNEVNNFENSESWIGLMLNIQTQKVRQNLYIKHTLTIELPFSFSRHVTLSNFWV